MILADCDIQTFQRLGMLNISPWKDELLQPASYDLTLAPYARYYDHRGNTHVEKFDEVGEDGRLVIPIFPNDFVLLSTIETVTLGPAVAGQVAGKSTLARCGLIVESAGFVDPGFTGTLTLEVKNIGPIPIFLKAGDSVAQIVFFQMRSKSVNPYNSERNHYQGQSGPTEALAMRHIKG